MAWSPPTRTKTVVASLVNVCGFALFLVVVFLTARYRWGVVVDVVALWFLWRVARPAGARWAREAEDEAATPAGPG